MDENAGGYEADARQEGGQHRWLYGAGATDGLVVRGKGSSCGGPLLFQFLLPFDAIAGDWPFGGVPLGANVLLSRLELALYFSRRRRFLPGNVSRIALSRKAILARTISFVSLSSMS